MTERPSLLYLGSRMYKIDSNEALCFVEDFDCRLTFSTKIAIVALSAQRNVESMIASCPAESNLERSSSLIYRGRV